MGLKEDFLRAASVGLSAFTEFSLGDQQTVALDPVPVEQTAPEPTHRDTENFFAGITQTQALGGAAAIAALIGLVFVFKKI